MSQYQEYKAGLEKCRASIELPTDCTAGAPSYHINSVDPMDPASWDIVWWLTFSDETYIVCKEVWSRGSPTANRHYLSFHYGPIVRNQNKSINTDAKNPVFLRICKSTRLGQPPHLHYKKPHPDPHYEQGSVTGLSLNDVTMCQFVQGVLRARKDQIELNEAFGFTLN